MSDHTDIVDPLTPPDLERTTCPLCGCGHAQVVVQVTDVACGIPGEYAIERCESCRHLFLNPRPTAETLHHCYPRRYGPHQAPPPRASQSSSAVAPIAPPPQPWYLRYLPLRRIPGLKALYYWLMNDHSQLLPVALIPSPDGKRPTALELGCSTGRYLAALDAAGWDVVGVEPSGTASEKARNAGFRVHTGILDDAPLEPCSFNCVAAWMVVEHVIDPAATVRKMFHLLKPGGQLLISIPNAGCWEPTVWGTAAYLWDAPRHLNHFTPHHIRMLLSDVGFVGIRVIHQKNILNIMGSLGIVLSRFRWTRSLGQRMIAYPDSQPRMWLQLSLSPLAAALSMLRQGGRITVLAERPHDSNSATQEGRYL